MASRRQIKDAFYDALVNAAATTHTVTYEDQTTEDVTVPESRVTRLNPDFTEELPAVAYDSTYITDTYNGVGAAPDNIEYDDNGVIQREEYREYVTGQFNVYVAAYSEVVKEPIYEAIRREFGQYDTSATRTSDFHTDVHKITVTDTSSADAPSEEVAIRGDQLSISVSFYRNYDTIDDVLESVENTTDIDDSAYENLTTN
jgi:hypothetical protein